MLVRVAPVLLAVSVSCTAFRDATTGDAAAGDAGAGDAGAATTADGSVVGGACTTLCPFGYWTFDEPAGDARILDASGNGLDGALGSVARGPGKRGAALDFTSAPGPAVVPFTSKLDELEGPQLSVAFWVWLADGGLAGSDQVLFQRPWEAGVFAPPYMQFSVEWDYNETRTVQLLVGDDAKATQQVAALTVPEGRWAHVAFVYDGALVRGFVDGVQTTATPMVVSLAKRPTDLRFGADAVSGQRFVGKLDDVRLYKGVLPPADVVALATP